MSEFKSKVITTAGQNLLAQNVLGANINFTKIVLGDGILGENVILNEMTELINEIIEIPINKFHQNGDNTVVVGGMFSNTQITEGFFYRELGLYADGGNGEVLYCYGNVEEFPDWIPPSEGNAVIEKFIEILTVIGNFGTATANVVRSTTANEIYSDSSYTGIENTDNVEDALKYVKENMITPAERTELGKLMTEGVKLNDISNVEIVEFDKPTLPVVTKQGTVKNFDVFNVNEITQKELTGAIATFTSGNIATSSNVVTYATNVLNEVFEIYTDGRIILKTNMSELNINLHSNITFAHKHGDKYLAYTLQKLNTSTGAYENLLVGTEKRVLANNDTNLNIEVEEYLKEQPLSAGTYRIIRNYRNNRTTCSYQVTGGTVMLYTDETLEFAEFQEKYIPKSIKDKLNNIISGVLAVGNAIKFNGLLSSQFLRSDLTNGEIKAQKFTIDVNSNDNTNYGYNSLKNGTGTQSTAVGASALYQNTSGAQNTAVGMQSQYENTTGIANSTLGQLSLGKNKTGSQNTAIGFAAAFQKVDGTSATQVSNGVYVGIFAKTSNGSSVDNEIAIGSYAEGKGNNTAHIGNSAISTISFGPATSTNFTNRSDERLKEDIELADLDICYDNIINKLPIKRFKYIEEFVQEGDKYKIGFIAQDFEKVLPKAVHKSKAVLNKLDKNGNKLKKTVRHTNIVQIKDYRGKLQDKEVVEEIEIDDTYETEEEMLSIDVSQLLPITIGAVQKIAKLVEQQEKTIKVMQKQIEELESRLEELKGE